jgi:hypothetical protein
MSRFATVLLLLVAGACDDETPAGPGRPNYPMPPICQFKTPCPQTKDAGDDARTGVADGGAAGGVKAVAAARAQQKATPP